MRQPNRSDPSTNCLHLCFGKQQTQAIRSPFSLHHQKVFMKSKYIYYRSTGNIKKNEFILPLHGEIITKSELERRKEIYSKCGENHLYPFQAGNYVIDTTRKGNSARFANHSCEPNLIAKRWIINNRKKGFRAIGFVALKNIAKNSELTFDYEYDYNPYVFSRKKKLFNATLFFRKTSQRCLCGTKTCKGWIGTPPPDVGPADEKKTSGSL
ncbi:hypothetical protein L3Y34_012455 [Caenorhabditis briggsae]|uniref:Uncharacterized protein n=1 Tax=Caenorhabditis briggsae TaxID=6238 RepID=A0AAE8ZZ18_CAEBR|nr:hypothetical protein L3Y34_012455 [Caenorhabditis briggsae]